MIEDRHSGSQYGRESAAGRETEASLEHVNATALEVALARILAITKVVCDVDVDEACDLFHSAFRRQ